MDSYASLSFANLDNFGENIRLLLFLSVEFILGIELYRLEISVLVLL